MMHNEDCEVYKMFFVDRALRKSDQGRSIVVFYETIKGDLNKRLTYECRCDARLKAKAERSTRLAYTLFHEELEHLQIKTRLIDEKLVSVMGECVFVKLQARRLNEEEEGAQCTDDLITAE